MFGELVKKVETTLELKNKWTPPHISNFDNIPVGDMPGDKIQIGNTHTEKANVIFPELLKNILPILNAHSYKRAVVSVHGGSGVGKSEIGSLLAYYFNELNISSYVLSGDNYPHRIPYYNDQERYRIFRTTGIKALVAKGEYTKERNDLLLKLQETDDDANIDLVKEYPWLSIYQEAALNALSDYLGTSNEIDFNEINEIISKFKNGSKAILLKRMGRELKDLWYDLVDFTDTKIIIVEWTHGNNRNFKGVDLPILLNSTPQETMEHRKSRNRDGKTDSSFTTSVLGLEQELLHSQSSRAKIIVSKNGEIISNDKYLELMK